MTDMNKRSLIQLAALSAVAAVALVGCGKKEEPAPAPRRAGTGGRPGTAPSPNR